MSKLYDEFLYISEHLNRELEIIPVLYGSLGLEIISDIDFSPQDIDILIPLEYIDKKWIVFKNVIEKIGYKMIDLHEHEFIKNDIKIAFAYVEDLKDFAGVDHKNLKIVDFKGARYKKLSLEDYLKVYKKSLNDGYRRIKKNNKDLIKIQKIQELL